MSIARVEPVSAAEFEELDPVAPLQDDDEVAFTEEELDSAFWLELLAAELLDTGT